MNKFVLLALVLTAASCIDVIQNTENDDRVKVDYYFESLCPYCRDFIVGQLKTAAATKVPFKVSLGFLEDLRFQLLRLRKRQKGSERIFVEFHVPAWSKRVRGKRGRELHQRTFRES